MKTDKTHIPANAINIVGFSLLEPSSPLQVFQPNWFNVWEAWLYQQANRRSGSQQWLFKRFGADMAAECGDSLRKAGYREWLNGLSQACREAFDQLGSKQATQMRQQRNGLIYFDSWGESAIFEGVNSWRDALSVDILPKNIVRDYGIQDFTCKVRGERNGCLQALRLAQDLLNSGTLDNLVLCGQYRNFPVLALSEAATLAENPRVIRPGKSNCQTSVERLGCMILRKAPGQGMTINLLRYAALPKPRVQCTANLLMHWQQAITPQTALLLSSMPPSQHWQQLEQQALQRLPTPLPAYALAPLYGDSGCTNPMLALHHLYQQALAGEHAVISCVDGQGGLWLTECWPNNEELSPCAKIA